MVSFAFDVLRGLFALAALPPLLAFALLLAAFLGIVLAAGLAFVLTRTIVAALWRFARHGEAH